MKEGYLIDPNHPAYPPQDVIEAAEKVGQWFDRHMVKDWKLGPVQERKDDGWISVEDRLPEDRQRVIIKVTKGNCFGFNNELIQTYFAFFVKGRTADEVRRDRCQSGFDQAGNNLTPYGWRGDGPLNFWGQDVSHWMPAPAAA